MPRPVRYLLIVLALAASPFIVGFGYGIWLGLTGEAPARQAPQSTAETPAVEKSRLEESPLEESPAPRTTVPEAAPSSEGAGTPVPDAWLTADSVGDDLLRRGWLGVQDGRPVVDRAALATAPVSHAAVLYESLREGGREYDGLRMFLFAAFAAYPEPERRAFAEAVGAASPTMAFVPRGWRGEYTRLFAFHDDGPLYVDALEAYARVLTDEEIIRTLRALDALLVDDGADGDWRIRVREKLGHVEPRVLLALRDGVDDALLGHRRYLRRELLEVAEAGSGR